ncbi:hypothetical protein [Pseudomonas typographi]|uniref:DUF2971 domain-containing protein n=1 Tax=Pseudomonas typographi TaxID=2715964 RepID=A0ABR7YXN1_9PSED|nr:hypothetical protein [Pseudomonas typographi]MBD1597906.1 hypothetical protein [Pseudomonas typographi]
MNAPRLLNISHGRLEELAKVPENPTENSEIGDVRIIGGKPYRTGFLNAFWGNADFKDPRVLLRAKRENILFSSRSLHHYTSLAGLKGIIEENGFWASDNRFMNDTEESLNGSRLAGHILQYKARRTSDAAFANVLLAVDELLASPRQDGHLVTCFSTVRDDLGQWRGYGAGGVCICLGEVTGREAPLFFGPDHMPFQAIYDEIPKRVLLLSVLRGFEREYSVDRRAMGTAWPCDHDKDYIEQIHSKISGSILGFKDRAFKNESEARIVLSYQQAKRYEGGLKFRVSPLGIIPYLRTGDHLAVKKHGGLLPLREIIIGPTPHQELVAKSVETFLRHAGYTSTNVSLSKVPYRTP